MAGYALPLWQSVLADTPEAYLVWIPALAVGWGTYAIRRSPSSLDDAELDAILGIGLLLLVGGVLFVGAGHWPYLFVLQDVGLLLWPLWALGMAWLLFGVGVTSALLAPLVYMLLCWPPILGTLASATQGVLVRVAIFAVAHASQLIPWLHAQGQTGTFLVAHGGAQVAVLISESCSGADSVLGAAILLPLLLTQLVGAWWRRGLLTVIALTGAALFNLLRLGTIIVALHFAGSAFALGVVHPALGFVLFAVLAISLMSVARWCGLGPLRRADTPLPISGGGRLLTSSVLSAMLFAALLPLFTAPSGALGKPLPVRSEDVAKLLPRIPGFRALSTHRYDDSSILGPGAVSVARTYVSQSGGTLLAEIWETSNSSYLESYGFDNCLLFHGERIDATRVFEVASDTPATDHAVKLPPAKVGGKWTLYEDIEWQSAVRTPSGAVKYLRYAIAALPQPSSRWPASLQHARVLPAAGGISSIAAAPAFGSWPSDLQGMSGRLERLAAEFASMVASQDAFRASASSGQ